MTYFEFKEKAAKFEIPYLRELERLSKGDFVDQIQKDYWSIVDKNKSPIYDQIDKLGEFISTKDNIKKFKVSYASDLNAKIYGYGFPTKSQDEEYGNHPWNFNNINSHPDSLLQIADGIDFSGINVPWLYIGMLYSSFCWHYEDLMMYSINYMHEGAGKMWYAIPTQHRAKFEKVAKKKMSSKVEDSNFLLHINSMVNPCYLVENGVQVYSTLQKPGEFILTFPESYHAGFSVGLNIAEAINFGLPSWLPHAEKAMSLYLRTREKVPVLPVQWIAVENAKRWNSGLKYSKEGAQQVFEYIKHKINEELKFRKMIKTEFKNWPEIKQFKVSDLLNNHF